MSADDERIHRLVDERVAAVAARDTAALLGHHAPDVVVFDTMNALQYKGTATEADRVMEWFASYDGPVGYEVRDLRVAVDGDVGFCHYLYRVSGTLRGGGEVNMWVRATLCLRRTGGDWRIVHEHNSAPFDANLNAMTSLEPTQ